jgi:hypothetical protein
MATRAELKALIDQLPEAKLDLVGSSLESILHPPAHNPRIEQFRQRSEEFQKQLPERLKQLQAGGDPSVARGFGMVGGTGGLGSGRRQAHGQYSYSWQEERARVTHRLILHAGHDIDIVERLEITVDERFLLYEQELNSGGRVVKRKEEFPTADPTADKGTGYPQRDGP